MANELRTEVEQVKEQEDVKRALKQTSTIKPDEETPRAETKDKLVLSTHVIILIALAAGHFLLKFSFLVHPKEAGRVKTRLIKKLLAELKAAPDRVLFPRSNMR